MANTFPLGSIPQSQPPYYLSSGLQHCQRREHCILLEALTDIIVNVGKRRKRRRQRRQDVDRLWRRRRRQKRRPAQEKRPEEVGEQQR